MKPEDEDALMIELEQLESHVFAVSQMFPELDIKLSVIEPKNSGFDEHETIQ